METSVDKRYETAKDTTTSEVNDGDPPTTAERWRLLDRNEFIPTTADHPSSTVNVETSKLCPKCGDIRTWLSQHWEVYQSATDLEHVCDHYDSLLQLRESALDGCHLCTLLQSDFNLSMIREQWLKTHAKVSVEMLKQLHIRIIANKFVHADWFIQTYASDFSGGPISMVRVVNTSVYPDVFSEISPLSTCISSASSATLTLAKEWINHCTKSHSVCARRMSSSLPTRLIDVMSSHNAHGVRVVETSSIPNKNGIRYAALSYCWGSTQFDTLKKSTYQALVHGVAIETLPKTIQDAIRFTQHIGLSWLWVDSLCIIQDSEEDWSRESLNMCQIYQDAFLTIAALGAASSDQGLFTLRDPLLYSSCFLFQTDKGHKIYAGFGESRKDRVWPLHQRGWVLQETLLASRTLNLGNYLVWQCKERICDEYNVPCRSSMLNGFRQKTYFSNIVAKDENSNLKDEDVTRSWQFIVELYTKSSLTVAKDRLVAISGIISAIQRRTQGTFWSGLWEPYLWKQILWMVDAIQEKKSESTELQPSWSWVSVTGAVTWDFGFVVPVNVVADVRCPGSITPFEPGWSESSRLRMTLKVSCVPIRLIASHDFITKASQTPFRLEGSAWNDLLKFIPDITTPPNLPTLFLPIACHLVSDYQMYIRGLAVSPSMCCAGGAFERVGYIRFLTNKDESDNSDIRYLATLQDPSRREHFVIV